MEAEGWSSGEIYCSKTTFIPVSVLSVLPSSAALLANGDGRSSWVSGCSGLGLDDKELVSGSSSSGRVG